MVRSVALFGVTHGAEVSLYGDIKLTPSVDLLKALKQFPVGTKVGIEGFSNSARVVNQHEIELAFREAGLPDNLVFPGALYWGPVWDVCQSSGHETFCFDALMSADFKPALIAKFKAREAFRDVKKRDSFRNYKRRIALTEKFFRADFGVEFIEIAEKDDRMIESIVSNELEVAVVGAGHMARWIQEGVGVARGINFSPCFLDDFVQSGFVISALGEGHRTFDCTLQRNPPLASGASFSPYHQMKRLATFFKTGRFTDKRPDWVGLWDVSSPSRGYFELFLEPGLNGAFNGRILDGLGDSRAEGELPCGQGSSMFFTKTYTLGAGGGFNVFS